MPDVALPKSLRQQQLDGFAYHSIVGVSKESGYLAIGKLNNPIGIDH
jgi:hypothetical protein